METIFKNLDLKMLLMLSVWVCSAIWYTSKFDSLIISLEKKTTSLEQEIKDTNSKLSSLKENLSSINTQASEYSTKLNSMDNRVILLENSTAKISTMANDISWLKDYLMNNQEKLGEALLKVLNDKTK